MNLAEQHAEEWLSGPVDEATKEEIRQLKNNPKALTDAFYTDLSFGTGGLRGLMGIGTNRMNIYTVRKATQGLANYILKTGNRNAGVVIGFDSRHNSELFAHETARVLAGNGIAALLLKELRPTPFVSFACRTHHAQAAVMITASHNPKEYNGYKVYWSDGGQIVAPHDSGIMDEVEKITSFAEVKIADKESSLIHVIDGTLDSKYLRAISFLSHYTNDNHEKGSTLSITYTSLHGTGITLMPQALENWGFTNVNFVESQIFPNGDFPTVKLPNPEYPETLQLGIEQMEKSSSDILLATDPDADRIGIAVMHEKKPIILNGNQVAAICVYYLCETLSQLKKMPPKGAFVTTIVTTELLKTICQAFDKPCFEVLTGFKYIGEKIHEWESSNDGYQFIFGAEESYGYLLGTHARDKDAIVTGCLIAEIALHMKLQGITLVDFLHEIYQKFGIFLEKQLSLDFFPGKEGTDAISHLMERLRKYPPHSLAGQKVAAYEDFEKPTSENLPRSNVLLFRLEDNSKFVIRPSGTEPKIKVYGAVHEKTFSSIEEGMKKCHQKLNNLLQEFQKDLR